MLSGNLLSSIFTAIPLVLVNHLMGNIEKREQKPKPSNPKEAFKEKLHNIEISDPFRWLEERNTPKTEEWIKEQNQYARHYFDNISFRDAISTRLKSLLRSEITTIPFKRGGNYFYRKRLKDDNLFSIYMKKSTDNREELLIDPHSLSTDHSMSVNILDVSDDAKIMAYGIREGGEDEQKINFFNIEEKKDLADEIPRGRYYGISINSEKTGIYYAVNSLHYKGVKFHKIGSPVSEDEEIFATNHDKNKIVGCTLSEDGRYLLIHVLYGSSGEKTEVYIKDVKNDNEIIPVVDDIKARFYGIFAGDKLLLETNWEAPRGRVLMLDLQEPSFENSREIIPQNEGVIESIDAIGGKIFVNYLKDVKFSLKVYETDGTYLYDVPLPALGTIGSLSGNWEDSEAFFNFESYHIPGTIYRFNTKSRNISVWAERNIPIDSGKFKVRQVWYPSKDGTKIPMFIVTKRDFRRNGNSPLLLTGYGGFNLSVTPSFNAKYILWIEKGGVLAVPNLRGGGEFGEKWHKAGMKENKQNVFDDFIFAAKYLTENQWTSSDKLVISGGSNGGLLVGATMLQEPKLFKAVVCSYPLLDMLRFQKFLVGMYWVSEYGSSDDPQQFEYLYSYSPYHNVKPGEKYPSVLFITGDADTRVDPLHARKMTAMLQDSAHNESTVLLAYDYKNGHTRGKPLSKRIEDLTDELSFMMNETGMEPQNLN